MLFAVLQNLWQLYTPLPMTAQQGVPQGHTWKVSVTSHTVTTHREAQQLYSVNKLRWTWTSSSILYMKNVCNTSIAIKWDKRRGEKRGTRNWFAL